MNLTISRVGGNPLAPVLLGTRAAPRFGVFVVGLIGLLGFFQGINQVESSRGVETKMKFGPRDPKKMTRSSPSMLENRFQEGGKTPTKRLDVVTLPAIIPPFSALVKGYSTRTFHMTPLCTLW